MATNRRRKFQKQRIALSHEQRMHLLWGWSLDVNPKKEGFRSPGFPFRDEEHRRSRWFENRDFLMAHMGRERNMTDLGFRYGARPAAWWDYESPESLAIIGYEEIDENYRRATGACCGDPEPIYESEIDFLERHGLLLPGEKEKALAFEEAERLREKALMEIED